MKFTLTLTDDEILTLWRATDDEALRTKLRNVILNDPRRCSVSGQPLPCDCAAHVAVAEVLYDF